MSEPHNTSHHPHEPSVYEIRVQGHRDARWIGWFDGLSFTHTGDGATCPGAAAARGQPTRAAVPFPAKWTANRPASDPDSNAAWAGRSPDRAQRRERSVERRHAAGPLAAASVGPE